MIKFYSKINEKKKIKKKLMLIPTRHTAKTKKLLTQ